MSYLQNQDPILLRVSRGGPLDRVLRPMLVDGKMSTKEEIVEQMGLVDSVYLFGLVSRWFDNLSVEHLRDQNLRTAHYTDVTPKRAIAVSESLPSAERLANLKVKAALANFEPVQPPAASTELGEEPVIWPDVPPQIQPHANFVEPKWYKTMKHMLKAGRHIRLAGPPSVGKDTAIKQAAWEMGKPLVSLNGSSLRERHMTGARAQDASGRSYFLPSQFAAAVVYGWWANITEVNAAEQDVLLYLNSITEEPFVITLNGRAYPVHPDFRLFISYNPGALGTRPIPASLADRFFPIKLDFHTETSLRKVLEANGMPSSDLLASDNYGNQKDWTACLVKFVMGLWETHENGKMKYQITVRRCMDTCELMKSFRSDGLDGFKQAVKFAIIDAIDNPLDAKEAEKLLKTITC